MSLGRAIATVGSFTLLSRIVGFVRDIVLSAVLGSGGIADAFFVALKLPNFFRRLFAEGAFSAAFVPLFARELQGGGREAALAFARQAHAGLVLVLVPFAIVLIAAMPWVLSLLAPGLRADPGTFDLAVEFSRIAFPYLIFISLASLYGGVLNGIDRFAEVAFTPVSAISKAASSSSYSASSMRVPVNTCAMLEPVLRKPERKRSSQPFLSAGTSRGALVSGVRFLKKLNMAVIGEWGSRWVSEWPGVQAPVQRVWPKDIILGSGAL